MYDSKAEMFNSALEEVGQFHLVEVICALNKEVGIVSYLVGKERNKSSGKRKHMRHKMI